MKRRWWLFILSFLIGAAILGPFLIKQSAAMIDWTGRLLNALNGATRLRIRSGGICHRDITHEKTLLDTTDAEKIKELIQTISIDAKGSDFHCMCCGNPTLEFYKDDLLIAELGFHHGRSLRWAKGNWPGDGLLESKSAETMIVWMAANGVTGPRDELTESKRRNDESRLALDRWNAAAPSILRGEWEKVDFINEDEGIKALELKLKYAVPDQSQRILQLINWFGAGEGPWSGFPSYESIPEKMLIKYKTEEILSAIQDKNLSEQQIEGFSRYFGGWSFSVHHPHELKLLPVALKKRLLDHSLKSDNEDKQGRARNAFTTE